MWRDAARAVFSRLRGYRLPEARLLRSEVSLVEDSKRLNLVLPCLSVKRTFGGAATALRLFEAMSSRFGRVRIIVLEEDETEFEPQYWPGWDLDGHKSAKNKNIAYMANRDATLKIDRGDVFIATQWATAYQVRQIMKKLCHEFQERDPRFIYLIQDFEPAFYPWSSQYLIAESTYVNGESTLAVFNTKLLMDYFHRQGYSFHREYCFEPKMNERLARLREHVGDVQKEKLILVYGRPSVHRNAFELLVEALHQWSNLFGRANEWKVVSLGEKHRTIDLGQGIEMRSSGKLTLDEYASFLARASVGLSLMVSPHPSYPPLEMADFGIRVITNRFAGKNLTERSENITSPLEASPVTIAETLKAACEEFEVRPWGNLHVGKSAFLSSDHEFPFLEPLFEELGHPLVPNGGVALLSSPNA